MRVMVFARFYRPCSGRFVAVGALLLLAALAIALAFPKTHALLQTATANGVLWVLLFCFVGVACGALWRRRWVSALFHLGAAMVLVGSALTAGYAKESTVMLVDSPIAPMAYRQRVIGGDLVTLESFTIERYPNGMPSQYRTRLYFPEGVREVAVNQPLRRKGFTYYQMSYAQAYDPYGRAVWQTQLVVRRDPGVRVVFAGYGLLVLAALLMALREVRR